MVVIPNVVNTLNVALGPAISIGFVPSALTSYIRAYNVTPDTVEEAYTFKSHKPLTIKSVVKKEGGVVNFPIITPVVAADVILIEVITVDVLITALNVPALSGAEPPVESINNVNPPLIPFIPA